MDHELNLSRIAAPMVGQSDLPFRNLVLSHGATTAFSQMLNSKRLIDDLEYRETWLRDLSLGDDQLRAKTVVQLCGNDPDELVQAARYMSSYCSGIDLNLGCPKEQAEAEHYGGYLLGKRDWPLVESMTKLRLCNPATLTPDLAERIALAGASFVTLHARTVSAKRRRAGAADLSAVKAIKTRLTPEAFPGIRVISNGNVREYEDLEHNMEETGADGLMVGEALLKNPRIFEGVIPDPIQISLEYLALCEDLPEVAPMKVMQDHIRRIIDHQWGRKPWFKNFRTQLGKTETIEGIRHLLVVRIAHWRGHSAKTRVSLRDHPGSDSDDAT